MSILFTEERPQRKTREEYLSETPADLQQKMIGILQDRNLLGWVMDGIADYGVAGERLLALTVYLTGTSRLLSQPLAVIVQGPSSSGKSYVIEKVAELFPEEAVLVATDLTPNALYYLPPGELEHRFVVSGERSRRHGDESAQATKALREMISSGRLVKVVSISDAEGPRSERIEQPGPIAYAESTTAPELFEEDANRCLVLQPDERPEQTRLILDAKGRSLAGVQRADHKALRQEFHCLHRLLAKSAVVVPFAEELFRLLPCERLEVRRASGQIGAMIQTFALLHQFQRDWDELGRVIAQPEDYWLARQVLDEAMSRALGQKSADALRRFVERVKDHTGEFTAKELAKLLNTSDRTVREHLQTLAELGLLKQMREGRGQIPAMWLITADLSLDEHDEHPLPSVEEVCGVKEQWLKLPELPAELASANLSGVPF
jgi:DNA primase